MKSNNNLIARLRADDDLKLEAANELERMSQFVKQANIELEAAEKLCETWFESALELVGPDKESDLKRIFKEKFESVLRGLHQ